MLTMLAPPKILIVDDRIENLITLDHLLSEFNVTLIRATSGEQALAHILDNDFALVLLDVRMPTMDGYEVAELMRGIRKPGISRLSLLLQNQVLTQTYLKATNPEPLITWLNPLMPTSSAVKSTFFFSYMNKNMHCTIKHRIRS
jgi:CheY-like chemotaxis protein